MDTLAWQLPPGAVFIQVTNYTLPICHQADGWEPEGSILMQMMVLFAMQSLHSLGQTGHHRSQRWAGMQGGMGDAMRGKDHVLPS